MKRTIEFEGFVFRNAKLCIVKNNFLTFDIPFSEYEQYEDILLEESNYSFTFYSDYIHVQYHGIDYKIVNNNKTYNVICDSIENIENIVATNTVLFNNAGICTTEKCASDNILEALSALKRAKGALMDLGYNK